MQMNTSANISLACNIILEVQEFFDLIRVYLPLYTLSSLSLKEQVFVCQLFLLHATFTNCVER